MSIALMSQAWRSGAAAGQKLVLLALCDHANDDGECRPSVPYLARKTSLGESTVRNHIATMEKDGILRRQYRTGRSTFYYIQPENFAPPQGEAPQPQPTPPESGAPQNPEDSPAESGGVPPQNLAPSPPDSGPRTINEPPEEPSGKRHKRGKAAESDFSAQQVLSDLGVSEQTIRDWIEHRKAKKAPVTETVLEGFVREAAQAGLTLDAALRYSIESNWIFFRATWYAKNHPQAIAAGPSAPGAKFNPTAYVNRNRKGDGQ